MPPESQETINQCENNPSKAEFLLQQRTLKYKQSFTPQVLTTEDLSKA